MDCTRNRSKQFVYVLSLYCVLPLAAAPEAQQVFTNFEAAGFGVVKSWTIGTSPHRATFNGNTGFRATRALYRSGSKAFWIERGGEVGTVAFETPAETVEFFARDVGSGGGRVAALGADSSVLATVSLTSSWRLYAFSGLGPIASLRLTNNGNVLSGIDDFGFTPMQSPPEPEPLADPIPNLIEKGDVRIELEPIAVGLTAPIHLTHAPGDPNRLFVVDQVGWVRVILNGAMKAKPFLDVSDRIVELGFFGSQDEGDFDERGLLGLAFHPDYNAPNQPGYGKLYTYTSEPIEGLADFSVPMPPGEAINHQTVIAEWSVDANNADRVNASSRRELLRIDQPQFNHDGGTIEFGPDGMLYIALGDGGSANDQAPGHGELGNGQNPTNILGNILRIDPTGSNSANGAYGLPADNPFVGNPNALDEIYAWGFRNPYRFGFDRATGDLIVGDVGQDMVEEIDIVVAGGNYGWNIKEGSFHFDPETGQVHDVLDGLPEDLIDPAAEYDHDDGITVIGGYVYRGSEIQELEGLYVFGDFSTQFFVPAGKLLYADLKTGEIKQFILGLNDRDLNLFVKGFGQDQDGELYLLAGPNLGPFRSSGQVYKIVRAECVPGVPSPQGLWGDLNHDCQVDQADLDILMDLLK